MTSKSQYENIFTGVGPDAIVMSNASEKVEAPHEQKQNGRNICTFLVKKTEKNRNTGHIKYSLGPE